MKSVVSSLFIVGIFLLCSTVPLAASAQLQQQTSTSAALQAQARTTLLRAIKPGMSFVTFRATVLGQGWAPITSNPPCLNQVDGRLCGKLPEVFDTSSGPVEYNEMSYRHLKSGEPLHVVVTGDISAWGTPDAKTELLVDSWDFGASG